MLLDLQGLKIALNGISTKIDSKVNKNQLPKPDWNESNPSHKNFIQNKTHGETVKNNYLLKNQYFSKLFYDGYYFDNPIELDLNKTYTVKYDDIPYILTPFVNPQDEYCLGNESFFTYNTFSDKNSEGYIPFVLNDYCIFIDDINSHTVEIILNDGENPQILLEKTQLWFDVEYFSDPLFNYCTYKIEYDGKIYDNLTLSENNPDLITDDFILKVNPNAYSFFDVYTLTADLHSFKLYQDGEIIIDTFIGFPAYMQLPISSPFDLQEETYYNIIWNNQSYKVMAKSSPYSSDSFCLGNQFFFGGNESQNTGEPFLIEIYPEIMYICGEGNNISFSIYEQQIEVQQLDPKFIPGALGAIDNEGSVSFGTGKAGGVYSFAVGHDTRASGEYSFTMGDNTNAGAYSCAEGKNTKAIYCAHAEGYGTEAGAYSHAEGDETKASGLSSHAEGSKTEASGMDSHAEGNYTTASNQAAHAEGCSTEASGQYSHAEGFSSIASGNSSHAEGFSTLAEKDYSHAEGYRTEATGKYSHAEGAVTVASGMYSHAEGNATKATGNNSHAEGGVAEAIGEHSHAEGYQTIATGSSQHVQGEWNVPDQNTSTPARTLHAHIVGNGTGTDARSNAHTLDWDGNAWFAGDVYVGSASGVNKDSGSKKLIATPSDAVAGDLLTYNGTNWVRISRADLIADIIAALPRAEEATF